MLTKTSYSMTKGAPINAFDYMTDAQIADVQANTALVDVTAALQAAINAAYGNTLVLPSGTYLVSSTLTIYGNDIHIQGQNKYATKIKKVGASAAIKIGNGAGTPALRWKLVDFAILGNAEATVGIDINYGTYGVLDNLFIESIAGIGIRFTDTLHISCYSCIVGGVTANLSDSNTKGIAIVRNVAHNTTIFMSNMYVNQFYYGFHSTNDSFYTVNTVGNIYETCVIGMLINSNNSGCFVGDYFTTSGTAIVNNCTHVAIIKPYKVGASDYDASGTPSIEGNYRQAFVLLDDQSFNTYNPATSEILQIYGPTTVNGRGITSNSVQSQVRAYLNVAQSISDSTDTVVIFNEEASTDPQNEYSTSTGVFTATTGGTYLVSATILWASAISSTLYIKKNSGFVTKRAYTSTGSIDITDTVRLAAGDTLSIVVNQATGSPVNVSAGITETFFNVFKIG